MVHVLKFDTDDLKNKFYEEYHFDTVPVFKLSDLIAPAKAWNAANKVTRTYGGGGGGTRIMQYIDVENEKVVENDIVIRDIEEGGYFVEVGNRKEWIKLAGKCDQYQPENIASDLKFVAKQLGINLDRIYIISRQTAKAKWFKQAKESGEWINVWDYLRENLEALNAQTLLDAKNYDDHCFICSENGKKIGKKVLNKKSPILNLIDIITANNYVDNVELVRSLENLYLWEDFVKNVKGTIDFQEESKKTLKIYPLLSSFGGLGYDNGIDVNTCDALIDYINAIDSWNVIAKMIEMS